MQVPLRGGGAGPPVQKARHALAPPHWCPHLFPGCICSPGKPMRLPCRDSSPQSMTDVARADLTCTAVSRARAEHQSVLDSDPRLLDVLLGPVSLPGLSWHTVFISTHLRACHLPAPSPSYVLHSLLRSTLQPLQLTGHARTRSHCAAPPCLPFIVSCVQSLHSLSQLTCRSAFRVALVASY